MANSNPSTHAEVRAEVRELKCGGGRPIREVMDIPKVGGLVTWVRSAQNHPPLPRSAQEAEKDRATDSCLAMSPCC